MSTHTRPLRAAPVVAVVRKALAGSTRALIGVAWLFGGLSVGALADVYYGQAGQWVASVLCVGALLGAWLWVNTVTIKRVQRRRVAYWDRQRVRVAVALEATREAREKRANVEMDAEHRADFATPEARQFITAFNTVADVVYARRLVDTAR